MQGTVLCLALTGGHMVRGTGSTKYSQELRRGALVLAVLGRLHREHYGYSLKKQLQKAGLEIDEGTLYPLLRRLEDQQLLVSRWDKSEGRPRRYYQLSPSGGAIYQQLKQEWDALAEVIHRVDQDREET